MPRITVDITDAQADFVKEAVASGEYTDTAQVLTEALARWLTQRYFQSPDALTTGEIRELWDEGVASGSAGRPDWDHLMDEVEVEVAKSKSRVA